MGAVMSELPDLSAQKPYALDQLAQLQGKIIQLSKSMVLQRARIERCRQSDLAAARDIYAELSRTRETLVETLAQVQLFLMEMEEYALAKVSGQLRQGLAGFALMSTGYKSVYEALSRFASSLPSFAGDQISGGCDHELVGPLLRLRQGTSTTGAGQ